MQEQCRVFGILRHILASQSMVILPMRCDFNGTKASADSEERNVFAGIWHLRRSPGQEDTKVVRQGQMDSYYERFCETAILMWWVWNMRQMTKKRRGRDMKLRSSQRLMDMKKQHWEFCSQYCQTHVLSVTDPSDQELNSVPQALGNVSSEIAKQSLPHAKKLKGTVKPSIGGR